MKLLFFILILLTSFCSKAQIEFPHPPYDKIIRQIDLSQKNDFDTVLSYIYVRGYPDFEEHELRGVGKVSIMGEAILVGFKKNTIRCIKMVDTYDRVFKSKPVNLKVDSIIQCLRNQIEVLRSERFLPCVIEIVSDTVRHIKGFSPVEP